MTDKIKKDWYVTLDYNVQYNDTYLIRNETKKDAIWIAENQNASSQYDCICIKEDEDDIEDVDTTIKEVVWNSEKKDWLDKDDDELALPKSDEPTPIREDE